MPSIGPPPEGFPPRGKLSALRALLLLGGPRKLCPHPALCATFPRGGRLLQSLVRLKQLYRLIHCRGQRAVIFQYDGGGGLIQRRALGFKLL